VARNLYVAVQPAVADVSWLISRMDFRSNEAGRTASGTGASVPTPKPVSAWSPVDATNRGRRSFVTRHEN
jgi:hypothetical protein